MTADGGGARRALAEELLTALAAELARGEGGTRRPASTYRLQLHAGLRVRRRRRGGARTSTRSASPTCTSRPSSPPRPARRTATTWWTTAGSTRSSGGEEAFAAARGRLRRAWHGAPPRLRPEPHGHRAGQPVVDGRARERAVVGPRARLRRGLDPAQGRARPQGARPGARRSVRQGARARRARARPRGRAPSSSATSTTSSRSRRARSRSCSATGSTRSAAELGPGDAAPPGARVDLRLAREARAAHRHLAGGGRGPRAGEGGREAAARRAVRGERPRCASFVDENVRRPQRHARGTRAASTCSSGSSTRRPTGSRSGGSPARRSTTAASST